MPPRPGDFAVVDTGTRASGLIGLGKGLAGGGFRMFDHAVICSRVRRDGTIHIVEALPDGAQETVWHYDDHDHLWSTGVVKTSTRAGKAALAYVGKPYSWLDFAAIAASASHLWTPGLRHYMASPNHLIGSQLVDQAELDAGIHLFDDRRWPGYVRPSDLAELILAVGELPAPERVGAAVATGYPDKDPYAGPNTTSSARSSVMSTKRCSSPAGTKITEPGPTSAVRPGVAIRARPAVTR